MAAANLDLAAELTAGAEEAKNEADGAFKSGGSLKVARFQTLNGKAAGQTKKAAALMKRALVLSDQDDHAGGAKLALKALDLAPDMALTHHMMGLMLFRLGRLSKALEFYDSAWRMDPKDPEIYPNMGLVAWKLEMLEAAEKFYRLYLQMTPGSVGGVINLSGVLRDQGKFEEAVEILRQCIYANPEEYELWNSLGTVLMESGEPDQAAVFYEECLRLKPGFSRAYNNLANVYELMGDAAKSAEYFEKALENPVNANDKATTEHSYSMVLLACGRLKEGWDANKVRLDPRNPQATFFPMKSTYWDGGDPAEIKGKKLAWIGEQGLGDEILFMNIVPDLLEAVGEDGKLHISCEQRLVELVQRSFPQADVSHHLSQVLEGRNIRVAPKLDKIVDCWSPMADAMRAFRVSPDQFPKTPGYLKPDPEMQADFRKQLDAMGSGPKVGILWKSLKMTARRSRFFSAFDAWEPVLKTPGVTFVNLQYGKAEDELKEAEERFGVKIHQPQDIDLKMDLDKVAALSSACDLVIGPTNATTNIAAACGADVWFIHARSTSWVMMGGQSLPWYPQTRSFYSQQFRDWETIMGDVAAALEERAKIAA